MTYSWICYFYDLMEDYLGKRTTTLGRGLSGFDAFMPELYPDRRCLRHFA